MDTAGMDDNYEPVRTKWIQDNQCFILTYSISELKSFEELTSMIRKIKVTKDFDSKNPIVVVGNMHDLGDEDRQVSEAEGIEFCSKEGLPFTEASAKSGFNIEVKFFFGFSKIKENFRVAYWGVAETEL